MSGIRVEMSSADKKAVGTGGSGVATFTKVPDWDGWKIVLDLRVIDGQPATVGVKGIEWIGGGQYPPVLIARRLGTLPLQAMADAAMRMLDFTRQPTLRRDLLRIKTADLSSRSDARSVTTTKQVAEYWVRGYWDPTVKNIKEWVADELDMPERTVMYHRKRAVELGLLPEWMSRTQTPIEGSDKKGRTTK